MPRVGDRPGFALHPWVDPWRRRDLSGYPAPIDLRPVQPRIATISPAQHLKRFALTRHSPGRVIRGQLWRADTPQAIST